MGLLDWLKGQLIDVIEWTDDQHQTIVYRYQRPGNEIKQGAKLIVRPGQVAIFVKEGEVADLLGPGTYELNTRNLPILTSLEHWDHGFESPFKAEVYFISTTRFTNLKWGTRGEVVIPDPLFGIVPIKAYGTFEIKVKDPVKFLREVVGTDGLFTTDEIQGQLANLIVSNLPKGIGELGISVKELAFHYDRLGEQLREYLQPIFEGYGLSLEKLVIENVSLPDRIKKAIEERVSQEILGDLDRYLKYKTAEGLEKGGGVADGIGAGIGLGIGARLGEQFQRSTGEERELLEEIRQLKEELAGRTSPAPGGTAAGPQPKPAPEMVQREGSSLEGHRESPPAPPADRSAPPPPPPPPPPPGPFYWAEQGVTHGPVEYPELERLVKEGKIGPETYLWRPGLEGWQRARELLPQLFR